MNKFFFIFMPFIFFGQSEYKLDTITGRFFVEIGPDMISSDDSGIPRETVLIPKKRKKITKNYKFGVYHTIDEFSSLNTIELQKILTQFQEFKFQNESDFFNLYKNILDLKRRCYKFKGFYFVEVNVQMVVVKLNRSEHYISNSIFSKKERLPFKEIKTSNYLIMNVLSLE